MILPIALAKERPHPTFDTGNYVQDVRVNAETALAYYYRVQEVQQELIKNLETQALEIAESRSDKSRKIDEVLDNTRRTLKGHISHLHRLIKFSDFATMTIISYPDNRIEAYNEFKAKKSQITDPILVRGIAAGSMIDYVKSKGQDFYFIETGYFGNYICEGNPDARKIWHRIVKNSMQHTRILDVPDDRLQVLQKFDSRLQWKSWKKNGSKILIVAPSEKPCDYYGINKDQWIKDTVETLKKHTDREIVVREKGDRKERISVNTIYEAFDEDVYAVVTYNSIAAAEAVAYGLPAFALAPTAADPVCLRDLSKIETPFYPDEDFVHKWLSSLAYCQYSLVEMLTGVAWKMVLENEQRPTICY
jgi:hypothetical protein